MKQLQLEFEERSGHRFQWTSIAAMREAQKRKGTMMRRVLEYLEAHGPSTDEEIHLRAGMRYSTVNPTRGALVDAGVVRDSGKVRKTTGGRWAILWEIVPEGERT
jgi:transcription initiation factor IIE alpha subunit